MSNSTITVPGPSRSVKVTQSPAVNGVSTVGTSVMQFDTVKNLLSNKPLKAPRKAQ